MRFLLSTIAAFLFVQSCSEKMPTQKDGDLQLQAIVADVSGIVQIDPILGYAPVPAAKVTLTSKKYFDPAGQPKEYVGYSEPNGTVTVDHLPNAKYTLDVISEVDYFDVESGITEKVTLRGSALIDVQSSRIFVDTLKTAVTFPSALVINEIYYCGPPNKAFYFYDQFVELYNTSEDTVYLDGCLLCRSLQKQHPQMETNDFVQVLYVYQFPGDPLSGREYPLVPGEFTVVAQDAYDHSKYIEAAPDLSGVDWEFYNPYGGDIDSPADNVNNILPERTTDFMINLGHNGIILADGSDYYYGESSESGNYQYVHIPIETVIDAVEYASNSESTKEITSRVDAGFAGVGMVKYSGKSVERRTPGFDTDNSSLDFVIIDTPTPGFQHE